MYFCDSCFKITHDTPPYKEHKKENIDHFNPIDTKCIEHPQNIVNLFCIDEKGKKIFFYFIFLLIELCCGICIYKNLHGGHKVLEVDDEESFKNYNITIDTFIKEFNSLNEKTITLKNRIEKEIEEINNLYDKVGKEVTQSFIEKHDKLKKEENDLKEKLQNETTKVKEKLELFLSESNEQIKINEKINKGIKSLKDENGQKNHIRILSYISKINKTSKNMENLFQELMRNLKISFKKDKNIIEFEEYYFNVI